MNTDMDGERRGVWSCPDCGEEHDDPNSIILTCCRVCSLIVRLSYTNEDGRRWAYSEGEHVELGDSL